jgi:hypothetical protein
VKTMPRRDGYLLKNIMFTENPLSRRYDTNQIILQGEKAHALQAEDNRSSNATASLRSYSFNRSRVQGKTGQSGNLHIGNSGHRNNNSSTQLEPRSAGTSTLPATLYPADGSVDASIGQAEA